MPVGTTTKRIKSEVFKRSKLLNRDYSIELKLKGNSYAASFTPKGFWRDQDMISVANRKRFIGGRTHQEKKEQNIA